jgi:hypothetical protein
LRASEDVATSFADAAIARLSVACRWRGKCSAAQLEYMQSVNAYTERINVSVELLKSWSLKVDFDFEET